MFPLAIDQRAALAALEFRTVATGAILAVEFLHFEFLGGGEAAEGEEQG